MENNYKYCIGLMSGTSLDGIDLAYVKMNTILYTDFTILHAETIPYSDAWKNKLQEAIAYTNDELIKLDVAYGQFLGGILHSFIDENKIDKIDFIASHGHTILHQPANGITLQIGNGQEIANQTNTKVVCDFRTQDVELGGQGAPLVPIGDKLLFSEYDYCINLGGFANISFQNDDKRIAFDICPVNIVMNLYAQKMGFEYDDGGKIASEGVVNQQLLEKLNALDFYSQNPPKSLGLEWVQENIFPLIDANETEISSVLRTFVEHVAIQISKNVCPKASVLITGGGVFNTFLMKRIQYYSQIEISSVSTEIINYKEALVFALLGVLRVDNQVNCLQSVTGAKRNHSSGKIFYPQK